ncbi:MAG: hypothetical protein V1735_01340 [Nanoarchaeota archaeon]
MEPRMRFTSTLVLLVLALVIFTGCELLDLFTYRPNPLLDEDCRVIPEKFNAGWKKYSDLDATIPVGSRSPEAQTFHAQETEIAQLSADVFSMKRDYEVVNELVGELRQYHSQLKAGHKANLIKTTVRMAYITYQTIDSAKGTGKLYSEFLTEAEKNGVKVIGKAIKLARSVSQKNTSYSLNTNTLQGKVNDVARTGWVETLASFGDPKDVALEMLETTKGHVLPSAELEPEELDILRREHLEIKKVDQLIQQSVKANFDRLWQIRDKEARISKLQAELWESEMKEKDRVKDALVSECKRNKDD